jgi:hypothetical protein
MNVTVRMAACLTLSVVGLSGCAVSAVGADPSDLDTTDDSETTPRSGPKSVASSSTSHVAVNGSDSSSASATGDAAVNTPADSGANDAGTTLASDAAVAADAAAPGTSLDDVTAASPSPAAPQAKCAVPAEAGLEDVEKPTTVVGTGTPESCTSSAFVAAVAKAGVITFNCGASPVTITLDQTAKVFNDKATKLVIDGGNKVTLSGGGKRRILYQSTCDEAQAWTTSHCNDQEFPQLTVQNLSFRDGNAKGEKVPSGGAIFAQGGRLKIVNSRFVNNVCADVGPDAGGGAVYANQQYKNLPVFVVGSTFGGREGSGNVCSNGGALSALGVSLTLINDTISYNKAVGNGANPATSGTPGGGSGGALYNNGTNYKLSICGSSIEHNRANEGGGAVFFVSGDRTGSIGITDSTLTDNVSGKFENYPGMFVQASGAPNIVNSTVK